MNSRGFSFRCSTDRVTVSAARPTESHQLTADRGHDMLVGFAATGEMTIAMMEALLRVPRLGTGRRRGACLAKAERAADERMVAIVPRGFDEHASEMGIAGLRNAAARAFGRSNAPRG